MSDYQDIQDHMVTVPVHTGHDHDHDHADHDHDHAGDGHSDHAHTGHAAEDSPMIEALVSQWSWNDSTVTYAFAPSGTPTYKGSYAGGSNTTTGWSNTEMAVVETVFEHTEAIVNLTFTEVFNLNSADMEFQQVTQVPGGYAGYAQYPSNFYGSTLVIGQTWVDPRDGNTVVHEIGHSLGLEHSHDGQNTFPGVEDGRDAGPDNLNSELTTTMSYKSPLDPLRPELRIDAVQVNFMAFDIAALQEIYGANMTTATGDDLYEATNYLMTIWDAGGTDEINFADAAQDAVIDLRAATLEAAEGGGGYFSFVYDGYNVTKGGYTIAHGVVIENATGGNANDLITGNAAANVLLGGEGNDTITGGEDRDTVKGGKQDDDLDGGAGNDTVNGEKGEDTITGGNGKDKLKGGGGKDTVKGGKGDDTITGGDGKDVLTGGKGSDRFEFNLGNGKDKIKDFDAELDILALDSELFKGTPDGDSVVDDYARVEESSVILDFGDGDTIRLNGFADDYGNSNKALNALADAIAFF